MASKDQGNSNYFIYLVSTKNESPNTLAGVNTSQFSLSELKAKFDELLNRGMHGISFSPYMDNQSPGDPISEDQIQSRMEILKPHFRWIRTFSCTEGNEMIPEIAKKNGLKTLVGAWLGADEKKNKLEIENLIKISRAGFSDTVAVGNEVLYREELTEDELLAYIEYVKKELPGIQVSYVDAYYEFCNRPKLTAACDVILANCYPFWEGCQLEYSLLYMRDMYHRVLKAAEGKKVIISETGWPDTGGNFNGSKPSTENAIAYFINAQTWAMEDKVDMFYFSSFDEGWKTVDEGDVGASWGLWDSKGNLKFIN